MSKFLHSGQFRDKFSTLRLEYEQFFQREIQRIRTKASNNPTGQPSPVVDECLENHARTYILNGMFEALNWPLKCVDGLPLFIPEAPIESLERGSRRFLDYLGLSPTNQKPLIVIEAKRPNLKLPSNENLPELISSYLRGETLGSIWDEILNTMKDYIKSVFNKYNYSPHRAVITNGNWLILFLNPLQTFVNNDSDSGIIIVYYDYSEILSKASEVWAYLEYTNVAGKTETRVFNIGELPFQIETSKIKKITLGLKLIYCEIPTQYKVRPQINVLPIILIALYNDTWICLQRNFHPGFDLPHKYEKLTNHLQEVDTFSHDLLEELFLFINCRFDISPLSEHYEQDIKFFDDFKGVNNVSIYPYEGVQKFILITGTMTHFLRETPTISGCRFHEWKNSKSENVAALESPIVMANVFQPKSFFTDGQDQHCTHVIVRDVKVSQLNPDNRQRIGLRSNPDGAAFCEIIQFEEFLCCRTCVFEDECLKGCHVNFPCDS